MQATGHIAALVWITRNGTGCLKNNYLNKSINDHEKDSRKPCHPQDSSVHMRALPHIHTSYYSHTGGLLLDPGLVEQRIHKIRHPFEGKRRDVA